MTEATELVPCFFCNGEVSPTAKKCRHCAEWLIRDCNGCGLTLRYERASKGVCRRCEERKVALTLASTAAPLTRVKNRGVAATLAFFMGGVGAHKFYLGRVGSGILYLLFFWTLIPALVGLCEGIVYAFSTEEAFQAKYGSRPPNLIPPIDVQP